MKRIALIALVCFALASCGPGALLLSIQKKTPWSASTMYSSGDFCLDGGVVYESNLNSNKGNVPASSPGWWSVY